MSRSTRVLIGALCVLLAIPVWARQDPAVCGTYRGQVQEDLYRHRRNLAQRARWGGVRMSGGAAAGVVRGPLFATRPDIGDIAIIEATDGVVASPNSFDLDQRTVTFTPASAAAASYRVSSGPASYDAAAAASGTKIGGFADDDTRLLTLPFRFPFFGQQYDQVYINSDGNLTFGASDTASSERSLGRFNAGPPRIAAMFDDLDPSASSDGVRVFTTNSKVVVSWVNVPEWTRTGPSGAHTFQLRMYPDGKIEFAWAGAAPASAVVGISPGRLTGDLSVVDLTASNSGAYSGPVSERFGSASELDFVMIAQKFFANHDDAYDYLIVFNGLAMPDGASSLASTRPIRVAFQGNGDMPVDFGRDYGSASRLKAVIHMAYPGQYPEDLNTKLTSIGRPTDTSISVLAHEIGHLWLAYASVQDPNSPGIEPMLGFGASHWSFNFNSEASLLEGNTIQDLGSGRFQTVRATEVYSPLDQYLMGLRAAEEVPALHPMFYVAGSSVSNIRHPALNVIMSGDRVNVDISQLLSRYGRRIPDQTVSQKRFRLGFAFVVPKDSQPSQSDLDKINRFRTMIEPFFADAASGRASVETTLRRALHVSVFPGSGVLKGGTVTAKVSVEQAPPSALTIALKAANGLTAAPSSVRIEAGSTSATFTITGLSAGVEELIATPSDPLYETVRSNIQVLDSASELKLVATSGADQIAQANSALLSPVVFRVVDRNGLPYPGIRVTAAVKGGGSLDQYSALSDDQGYVQFRWTTAATAVNGQNDSYFNQLTATVDGGAAATVYSWSRPSFTAAGVVNAASFAPSTVPGSLASIFGVNLSTAEAYAASLPLPVELSGTQVLVNGTPAPLLYVSPLQINFLMPPSTPVGNAVIQIVNAPLGPLATSAEVMLSVAQVAPAIFNDPAAGVGAIHVAGERVKTNLRPAHPGEYVEIYATGLGSVHTTARGQETDQPVTVYIGGQQISDVPYAGLNGTYVGLYQVNAKIPPALAPGRYPVVLEIAGRRSPEVFIEVR